MVCRWCRKKPPEVKMYDDYYCEECMDKRTRIVRVHIDSNTIVDMLSGRVVVTEGLPDGCEFLRACFNAPSNSFELIVRHPSFDKISPGAEAPLIHHICFKEVN